MIASATQLGSRHMPAVGLEHHRATGGQGGSGVATGGGERQREIARTEHRDRADADPVLTQIHPWQRLTFGQGAVDARAIEIATAQDLSEQAHLTAGATALTLNTPGRQRRLAGDQGNELIVQCIQLRGDGLEKFRAAARRQVAEGRVGGSRGLGGGVDFFNGGLRERVGQRFTGAGVMALHGDVAGGTARTADVVVADDVGHEKLLSERG